MSNEKNEIGTATKPADAGTSSYAEDRAMIEDLQARYLFAMDFGDPEKYARTFTEDGVIKVAGHEWRGYEALKTVIAAIPKLEPHPDPRRRPATGRHCIINMVIKIDGNKATGRAYWFHMLNNNPQRSASIDLYGHYEDELEKVNGKWLFKCRQIRDEQFDLFASTGGNPCW